MNNEELQKEYERFRDECVKLTNKNSRLEVENAKIEKKSEEKGNE